MRQFASHHHPVQKRKTDNRIVSDVFWDRQITYYATSLFERGTVDRNSEDSHLVSHDAEAQSLQ